MFPADLIGAYIHCTFGNKTEALYIPIYVLLGGFFGIILGPVENDSHLFARFADYAASPVVVHIYCSALNFIFFQSRRTFDSVAVIYYIVTITAGE